MNIEEQNNKLQLLGKLSASLSHEIRNPLSALKLSLEMIREPEEVSKEEYQESLQICVEAAERIEYLIQAILEFSRKPTDEKEWLTFNDIIKKLLIIYSGSAKKKGIYVITELADDLPPVFVNKNKMLHVFVNLINNAVDASPSGSKIVVKSYTQNSDSEIVVSITDTGVGISEENKNKIFTDFFTNKSTGTGLGLTVCNMIVREYSAKLTFESELGKGTTFYVIFPNTAEE